MPFVRSPNLNGHGTIVLGLCPRTVGGHVFKPLRDEREFDMIAVRHGSVRQDVRTQLSDGHSQKTGDVMCAGHAH